MNVKDNAENVRIYAYPSNINAKAAVAADRAAALAAAGTVVVGTLDTPLQSGENRFYIAVTPSTHDSDTHYPKEVHELIINRMSANIGVDLKFGEYSLSLAADGKTYDFELPASTDGSDNSVAKFTAVAENAGTKVKISDVATYHVPENATSADAMENVRAAEPEPTKCAEIGRASCRERV